MAEQRSRVAQTSNEVQFKYMVNDEAEDVIDLMELLFRIVDKWKQILCVALVLAAVAGVYSGFFMTPMYEASATIYVLNRRDSAINMSDLQIGSALTADYIKVFEIWEVHEAVITNLDLPYTYKQMENMLAVGNKSNTRMLDITVTSADPQEAALIAGEYASVVSQYIADTMAMEKPSLMSSPLVPTNPVSPNKTLYIMVGFVLGACLMIGYYAIEMILDDKYKTAEDIQRYAGLVTLAAVPTENAKPKRGGYRRREAL